MKRTLKRIFNTRNLMRFTFFAFIASTVLTVVEIIIAPSIAPPGDENAKVKADYIYLLIQCVIGIFAMIIPGFLRRRARLSIPSAMLLIYALFIFGALYLGFVRSFYVRVPHWDTIMHTFNGVALGALGFSIISMLNKSESVPFSLSPVFVAVFAFCFSVTIGVMWEIYEFAMDYFFDTNMQRYAVVNGDVLIGKEALADTMKDLIVDSLGAFVISAIGYISLKRDKSKLERFQVKPKRPGSGNPEDVSSEKEEKQKETVKR